MKNQQHIIDIDAIVLAGGESRRMGRQKATLPLGDTTAIEAVLSLLRPIFQRILVVTRNRESLPELKEEILMDGRPERGPLAGLARGLGASSSPWCFVVGCDMPFLHPGTIGRMAANLEGCDILAACLDGRLQPLHAFYSRACITRAEELLAQGITSLKALHAGVRVRHLTSGDFEGLGLASFKDMDTLEDYQAARALWEGAPPGSNPESPHKY